MNRNATVSLVHSRHNVDRQVRPDEGLRGRSSSVTSARKSTTLEFLGAVLPLILAMTSFCMVFLSGPLIETSLPPIERLLQQNELLLALVCALAVAVFGLALKNVKSLKR
jgi:hypothetical protein